MAVTFNKKVGKGTTSVESKKGVKETSEQKGEITTSEPVANVGVSLGTTVNIGNYNNIKINVSLHLPCTEENVDTTFNEANEWCQAKLQELHDEVVEPNK